jgi:hypothetical protein
MFSADVSDCLVAHSICVRFSLMFAVVYDGSDDGDDDDRVDDEDNVLPTGHP